MHAVRKEEVRRSQRWKLPLEKCVWPGCVSRAPSYAPESLKDAEAGAPRPLPGGLEVLSPLQACSLLPLQGRAVPSKVGSPSSRAPSDPDTCSREPYPKQGDTLSVVGQETAPSPSPSHHSVELSSPAYGPTPRPPGGAAAPRDEAGGPPTPRGSGHTHWSRIWGAGGGLPSSAWQVGRAAARPGQLHLRFSPAFARGRHRANEAHGLGPAKDTVLGFLRPPPSDPFPPEGCVYS